MNSANVSSLSFVRFFAIKIFRVRTRAVKWLWSRTPLKRKMSDATIPMIRIARYREFRIAQENDSAERESNINAQVEILKIVRIFIFFCSEPLRVIFFEIDPQNAERAFCGVSCLMLLSLYRSRQHRCSSVLRLRSASEIQSSG